MTSIAVSPEELYQRARQSNSTEIPDVKPDEPHQTVPIHLKSLAQVSYVNADQRVGFKQLCREQEMPTCPNIPKRKRRPSQVSELKNYQ